MFQGKFQDSDVPMMLFGLTLFLNHVPPPLFGNRDCVADRLGGKDEEREKNFFFFSHKGDFKLCELEH